MPPTSYLTGLRRVNLKLAATCETLAEEKIVEEKEVRVKDLFYREVVGISGSISVSSSIFFQGSFLHSVELVASTVGVGDDGLDKALGAVTFIFEFGIVSLPGFIYLRMNLRAK